MSPDGRFGSCLETFRGMPVEDKEHRALIENRPDLSPQGPFTLELWIKPKPELNAACPHAYPAGQEIRRPCRLPIGPRPAGCGRQEDFAGHRSASAPIRKPGTPGRPGSRRARGVTSPSLTTARAKGAFISTASPGAASGSRDASRSPPARIPCRSATASAAIMAVSRALSIRSAYRTRVLEFRRARVERISDRACFVRMESPASLRFAVTNLQRTPLVGAEVSISLDGMAEKTTKLAALASGKSAMVDYPLDTSLRPDAYQLGGPTGRRRPRTLPDPGGICRFASCRGSRRIGFPC